MKGRFDIGKTRAHYVLMPLHDPAHWSRYTRVLQGSNGPMAEMVVENGYKMQGVQDGLSIDGVGGNEQELGVEGEAAQGNRFGRSVDAGAVSFKSSRLYKQ